jgi:hypothetical protein
MLISYQYSCIFNSFAANHTCVATTAVVWKHKRVASYRKTGVNRDRPKCLEKILWSRLGGVMDSVFATGPKGRGFELCQGGGFLRATKIRSTPSFGWEVKPEVSRCKILRHVKELPRGRIDKIPISFARSPTHSINVSADRTARQYWWLPERSGDRLGVRPSRYHHTTVHIAVTRRWTTGQWGRSSETSVSLQYNKSTYLPFSKIWILI